MVFRKKAKHLAIFQKSHGLALLCRMHAWLLRKYFFPQKRTGRYWRKPNLFTWVCPTTLALMTMWWHLFPQIRWSILKYVKLAAVKLPKLTIQRCPEPSTYEDVNHSFLSKNSSVGISYFWMLLLDMILLFGHYQQPKMWVLINMTHLGIQIYHNFYKAPSVFSGEALR